MMWALVIIVLGYGSSALPAITVIDFPTQGACEKAEQTVMSSGEKLRAMFAISCVQKGGIVQ